MKWLDSRRAGVGDESLTLNSDTIEDRYRSAHQLDLFPETKKKLPWLLPLLVVILVIGFLTASAFAQEVKTSGGMSCDTAEQVKQIVRSEDKNAELAVVNTGEIPACVLALFAYVETGNTEIVIVPDGVVTIIEVVLIAFSLDQVNWIQAKPVTQYIPFLTGPKEASVGI